MHAYRTYRTKAIVMTQVWLIAGAGKLPRISKNLSTQQPDLWNDSNFLLVTSLHISVTPEWRSVSHLLWAKRFVCVSTVSSWHQGANADGPDHHLPGEPSSPRGGDAASHQLLTRLPLLLRHCGPGVWGNSVQNCHDGSGSTWGNAFVGGFGPHQDVFGRIMDQRCADEKEVSWNTVALRPGWSPWVGTSGP